MEVPFISSGALSRAHYTLVRAVEEASSTSQADHRLLDEVDVLQQRLRQDGNDLTNCREYLLRLFYCATATTTTLPASSLAFAFPAALNLAEAGRTSHEKRVGYLFCAELLPPTHELQLMLVNTVRKDLADPRPAVVTLALDALVQCPSEDVVPAVDRKLVDLVSNAAPAIRRRAILALRALSGFRPDLLLQSAFLDKLVRRLKDADSGVVLAALSTIANAVEVEPILAERFKTPVNDLLWASFSSIPSTASTSVSVRNHTKSPKLANSAVVRKTLAVLRIVGILEQSYDLIDPLIRLSVRAGPDGYAMLYQVFLLFVPASPNPNSAPAIPLDAYLRPLAPLPSPTPHAGVLEGPSTSRSPPPTAPAPPVQELRGHPNPVKHIRPLLTLPASSSPSHSSPALEGRALLHQYTFLSCLACVDPRYWAGIAPEYAPVLEGWEVERVMGLLECDDGALRMKTLAILVRIDPALVEGYLHRITSAAPPELASHQPRVHTPNQIPNLNQPRLLRALEAIDVLHAENGEAWALAVLRLLRPSHAADSGLGNGASAGKHGVPILEGVISRVLRRIEDGTEEFKLAATTTVLASAIDHASAQADPVGQAHPTLISGGNPTYTTILAALAAQYTTHLPSSPALLLRALARELGGAPPSVQDAVLLAMVRMLAGWDWSAEYDEYDGARIGRTVNIIDLESRDGEGDEGGGVNGINRAAAQDGSAGAMAEAVRTVRELGEGAGVGRGVKRRCAQFLAFLGRGREGRAELRGVVERAASPSLPGFLASLEPRSPLDSPKHRASSPLAPQAQRSRSQTPTQSSVSPRAARHQRLLASPPLSPSSTSRSPTSPTASVYATAMSSMTTSKLRYDAYDAPPPPVSLRPYHGQKNTPRSPPMAPSSSLGLTLASGVSDHDRRTRLGNLSPSGSRPGSASGFLSRRGLRSPVGEIELADRDRERRASAVPVTPGEIALLGAGGRRATRRLSLDSVAGDGEEGEVVTPRASKDFGKAVGRHGRQESTRPDLIALDSPFITDPSSSPSASPARSNASANPFSGPLDTISSSSESLPDVTFERTWNALDAASSQSAVGGAKGKGKARSADVRGWSSSSVEEEVVAILRDVELSIDQGDGAIQLIAEAVGKEQSPFEGDVKLTLVPLSGNKSGADIGLAAIRLRPSESESEDGAGEGGTFWRLRCARDDLRSRLKEVLGDM